MDAQTYTNTPAASLMLARSLRARLAALHQELHRAEELGAYFEPSEAGDARPAGHAARELARAHRGVVDAAHERVRIAQGRIAETRRALEALRGPSTSTCGARCRDGHACRAPGNGRGGRCKLHGGRSTGAKTDEGRARCRAAAWRRWHPARA